MSTIHRLGEILKDRGARKALADAINTSPSVISDLCSGNDRLNDDLIEKIAKALSIPAWHLFVDPEDVYPNEHQKIVSAYLGLSDGLREAVDKLLFGEKNTSLKKYVPMKAYIEERRKRQELEAKLSESETP
jgi:transcriptional regulator with XRE-family HTH domain